MKQKKFGSNGPDVSVIGQGTWYLDRGDRKRAIAALERGIEAGMTHIDTAEMYGDAELVIADAIAGNQDGLRGFRTPCIIVSPFAKRGHIDHTTYDTTSIAKFITRRFDLEKLPGVREKMGDLTPALDLR